MSSDITPSIATDAMSAAQGAARGTQHVHGAEPKFDFWRAAHRALRGRYRVAFLLATGGAIVGAWCGGLFGHRLHSATGVIRIASQLPSVMRETDQNRPIAMFDGYIQAQRDLLISREMVHAALASDVWQRASLVRRTPTPEAFSAGLKAETRQRSDHIKVTFTHKDPAVAAAGVQTIIAAHKDAFLREQARVEGHRQSQLVSRRDGIVAELAVLEEEMKSVAGGRTSEELDGLMLAATERGKKLRSALADVQAALAGAPIVPIGRSASEISPRELVASELLRAYVDEQAKAEIQLQNAQLQGFQPSHPQIKRLEAAVKEYRERVIRYTEECDLWRSKRGDDAPLMSLSEREQKLSALADAAGRELSEFAMAREKLTVMEARQKVLRESLAATEARLDALTTEASAGSRLSIVSGSDKPLMSIIDSRAKMSFIGLVAGMSLPLLAIITFGTLRHRYRYGDDLAFDLFGRANFVAALPTMDAAQRLGPVTASCLHALRVRLQPGDGEDPRAYLVTSTKHGEGKTGISLALALSFTAAGYRTLLIDSDLAARHLTEGVGATESAGLLETALGSEPTIHTLGCGVHFMATGKGAAQRAFKLSPPAISKLLQHVRQNYQVIIIDGDPILDGFAASLFAPHMDGVVLTMSAGAERSKVMHAIKHIMSLGGVLTAAVLNHVAGSDINTKASGSYPAFARDVKLPERLERFGPLVASMFHSLSYSRERELDIVPTEQHSTESTANGESARREAA